MQVPSAATICRLARRRPLILLYHRVADLEVDPWGLAVRPAEFERHIRLVSSLFTIVPLASLVPQGERAAGSRGRIAITFDDGYRDNFENAWPLLQRWGVPATFFISCSTLESGRELWWDTLERLLLWPGTLPPRLAFEIDGASTHVEPGNQAYSDRDFLLHKRWTAGQPPPTARHRAFLTLWARLRDMNAAARDRAIDDLCAQARIDVTARTSHRAMRPDHVCQMSRSPLVEIGAHGVSHRRLSSASADEQRREVTGSKQMLETICGKAVTSFSYPFGGRDDYSSTTIQVVRAGGFHRACTGYGSTLGPECDRLEVPRCFVPPGGMRTLLCRMASWLASPAQGGSPS